MNAIIRKAVKTAVGVEGGEAVRAWMQEPVKCFKSWTGTGSDFGRESRSERADSEVDPHREVANETARMMDV